MKLFIFAVFALVAVEAVSLPPLCEVGKWSDWGECKSEKRCVRQARIQNAMKTYHLPATDAWDAGRAAMEYNMLLKETHFAERAACIARGSCPTTLADRPSSSAAKCVNGLAADLPCNNVDLLSFVNFDDMGYVPIPSDTVPGGNDVWGWTDPQNGDEYAIMCLKGATTFVRITDPVNPVPVGIIYSATTATTWRDAKVIGNYVYIVAESGDHGLQVFDLTRLRGLTSVQVFQPDATEHGFGSAHNIVSNEETNYVYVVGARGGGRNQATYPQICGGGLYVIDVKDPLNPTFSGCYGGDGYVHDAQCVIYHGPDTRYQGREICFSFNEDTFTIVDVTDKKSMTLVSKTGYNGYQYTHQGWATEDHTIVLVDDELDESRSPFDEKFTKTYVWDVRDLKEPVLKSVFESPERAIDHNQYIIKDLVFQGNYEAGLRILHIDQENYQLTQVGYFDVLPSRTTANFAGAWSVFPYYKSGNVAVSSIDYGLFIVKPNFTAIRKQIEDKTVTAEKVRTREVLNRVAGSACPALQESMPCSAEITC